MLNRRVKRVLLALGMSLAIVSLTTGCSMLKKQPETESETEKQTEKQTAPESEFGDLNRNRAANRDCLYITG